MELLWWALLVGGALLDLYSRTIGAYDSTLRAMGGTALRILARCVGALMMFVGLGMLVAQCAHA